MLLRFFNLKVLNKLGFWNAITYPNSQNAPLILLWAVIFLITLTLLLLLVVILKNIKNRAK